MGAEWRLFRSNKYSIDAHVTGETLCDYVWSKPPRRAADIQQAITGCDEIGAFFDTPSQRHLGSKRQRICQSPTHLLTQSARPPSPWCKKYGSCNLSFRAHEVDS
jgi:hypothetical protein